MNIPTGNRVLPQPIDISAQHGTNPSLGLHTNVPAPQPRAGSVFQSSKFRRESLAHSGGMGGVSWGSVTIGSWLKDEVMMMGLLANNGNVGMGGVVSMSPVVNSSHYLPNLEADYCRDYSCCGQLLPTLHDLLRHYEEAHISPSPPLETPRVMRPMQNIMEAVSTNEVFLSQNQQNLQLQNQNGFQFGVNEDTSDFNFQFSNGNLNFNPGISTSMFDTATAESHNFTHNNAQFEAPAPEVPAPLHTPQPQHQQIYQQQFQQQFSPHHQPQPQFPSPNALLHQQLHPNAHQDDEDAEMCIDDPARHLYVMERQEHKPFKCPVIGCDKNYKNQNGLKYHRLHGHQNQMLHANPDGSFSIIDPESNTPYPEGLGMEKDKPYRCEVCGKRYKNLNGLKYHRGHTTH
ncbi:hypothetical protein BABINDRAFT_170036 [Babjeviella inositovora NRRL Y-12698]|uniref:C2H2-type domain-containing protein n=1 Tax=Babjeviella inositovora NRRL Y-12698 TaxID=984486 RepID=A0A1E3QZ24_9ASCO|nr:uncharacterized protein BABINDRAFT_170036 [Babjeviella inositovora NRRL Y-12698]ODQ82920.1 hypothetical protein BABINDRAFT_170036 [Babjeviella inositovora NRRL Y-12698]